MAVTYKSPSVRTAISKNPDAYVVEQKGIVIQQKYHNLEEVLVSVRTPILDGDGEEVDYAPIIDKIDDQEFDNGADDVSIQATVVQGDAPISWKAVNLPTGLTMDEEGEITGTIDDSGVFNVIIEATNAGGTYKEHFKITVSISITDVELSPVEIGGAFSETLTTNGITPVVWTLVKGKFPEGIDIDNETGEIVGMPLESGEYDITIQVEDDNNTIATIDLTIEVTISISTESLANAQVGVVYDEELETNGIAPLTWSITDGELPEGLELDVESGVITGTPAEDTNDSYELEFKVVDANGATDTATLTLVVDPAA